MKPQAGTQNWLKPPNRQTITDPRTKDIAEKWMGMELNGKAPVPHWAKQWSYLNGIDRHIEEVTKSLDLLKKANCTVLVITKAKELSLEELLVFSNGKVCDFSFK